MEEHDVMAYLVMFGSDDASVDIDVDSGFDVKLKFLVAAKRAEHYVVLVLPEAAELIEVLALSELARFHLLFSNKAQQAISAQRETKKIESSRERSHKRQEEKQARFIQRAEKRKRKHRGR